MKMKKPAIVTSVMRKNTRRPPDRTARPRVEEREPAIASGDRCARRRVARALWVGSRPPVREAMGRAASSSSSSDSSSSSSSHERRGKKRKREKEKKRKRERKSESKKRRKREDDPERERLKRARRPLKRRTRAADEALVPSAAAEKKRKPNRAIRNASPSTLGPHGAAGEIPLTAAQEAAARVAAARAAALQEDAVLARLGAPREDVLGFRNASIAGLAGLDAHLAAAPGGVGASSFDARRIRQKKAAERLEALLPAPATGREALLEKRAAARASNREMANAKEEGMFASGFGGELGGGGADEFRAALAANRMKREARNRRRGVDGASAALRLREHRRLEAEKMGAFQDMVGGLGEGERIEIPRRE